ncbi:MAG: hypothetical protein WBC44_03745 [Planctomycetaceae bacterium]
MIGIREAKAAFFDVKAVMDAVDRHRLRALSRFGYFVRQDSRQSIRKRKRPSRPGQAPSNRTGLLKRFILFSYDAGRRSVVIGPARLSGVADPASPEALEAGGSTKAGRISPRPYMKPAFDRQLEKHVPAMWRNGL